MSSNSHRRRNVRDNLPAVNQPARPVAASAAPRAQRPALFRRTTTRSLSTRLANNQLAAVRARPRVDVPRNVPRPDARPDNAREPPGPGSGARPPQGDAAPVGDGRRPRGDRQRVPPGPAPGDVGSSSEPVPTPVVTPKKGYVQAALSWVPWIRPKSPAFTYIASLGITPIEPPVGCGSENLHSAQAAERSVAIVGFLAYAYGKGFRDVCNIYSDPRESKFNSSFNKEISRGEKPMNIHRYTPVVVQKDRTRSPTDADEPLEAILSRSDCALFVDIYSQSEDETKTFSPEYVARIITSLKSPLNQGAAFWIGRKFLGDAGVIAKEGAWCRFNDTICYRSSATEPCEYNHDPCDWIWGVPCYPVVIQGQTYHLTWTIVKVVGSFYTVMFSLQATSAYSSQIPLFSYEDTMVDIPIPSSATWRGYLQQHLPFWVSRHLGVEEKMRVYRPFIQPILNKTNSRRFQAYNIPRISLEIEGALNGTEALVFHKCFPGFDPSRNIENLANGVFMYRAPEKAQAIQNMNATHGSSMVRYNQEQAKIGVSPSSVSLAPWLMPAIVSAAVLGIGAYGFMRSKTLSVPFAASLSFTYSQSRNIAPPLHIPNFMMDNAALVVRCLKDCAVEASSHVIKCVQTKSVAPLVEKTSIFQRIMWSTLIATYLNVCVISPVWEEAFKRSDAFLFKRFGLNIKPCYWFLPVFEFGMSVVSAPAPLSLSYLALRALVLRAHFYWADQKSYWRAVALHAGWNFVMVSVFASEFIAPQGKFFKYTASLLPKIVRRRVIGDWRSWVALTIGACALLKMHKKMKEGDVYRHWKQRYFYDVPWEEKLISVDVPSATHPIDPEDFAFPTSRFSSVDTRPGEDNHLMEISGEWLPDIDQPQTLAYHILPTCVPGYVPQVNYQNLNAAVSARILTAPPMDPKAQLDVWNECRGDGYEEEYYRVLQCGSDDMLPMSMSDHLGLAKEWVDHFKVKKTKNKYARLLERIESTDLVYEVPKFTQVFLKANEMLLTAKEGCMSMKPRVISNVSAKFQIWAAPFIYKAQKMIGKVGFPLVYEKPYFSELLGIYISIHYAGASTDADLTQWMADVLDRRFCPSGSTGMSILVSGDDSLVALYTPTSIRWGEGDATKFDQSQSFGPLQMEHRFLNKIGVPKQITDGLMQVACNCFVLQGKAKHVLPSFIISKKHRPIRDTGGSDTSLGNSTDMSYAWLVVLGKELNRLISLKDSDLLGALEERFMRLGFSMKLKLFNKATEPTFLKGMWYPTVSHGLVWGPLPSRILKAGKSLRDPREIYGCADIRESCKLFLGDVANGYSHFLQVPIMAAFCSKFSTGRDVSELHYTGVERNPHKIVANGSFSKVVLDDSVYDIVAQRYGLEVNDLERVEVQIMESSELSFLSDLTYVKLRDVDYA